MAAALRAATTPATAPAKQWPVRARAAQRRGRPVRLERRRDDAGTTSDDDGEGACTVADLVQGTAVHEADLHVTSAGTAFEEIQLVKAPPAPPRPPPAGNG